MYIELGLLFCATLLSGLLIFALPKTFTPIISYTLAFGGSYLFALTLVHMLPELFAHHSGHHHKGINLGLWLLIGFSFQILLDLLGGSIAHGHVPGHTICTKKQSSSTGQRSSFTLLVCLFFHSALEGVLWHEGHNSLLLGMVLHKVPVAFTLGSVLVHRKYKRRNVLLLLAFFAGITPISILLRDYLVYHSMLSGPTALKLHAMAIGGVFHIATTIIFEANPHHQLSKAKWIASLLGAVLAVGVDHVIAH